jgi:hypothetical protein
LLNAHSQIFNTPSGISTIVKALTEKHCAQTLLSEFHKARELILLFSNALVHKLVTVFGITTLSNSLP